MAHFHAAVSGAKRPIFVWSLEGGDPIVTDLVANTRASVLIIKPSFLETGMATTVTVIDT